MYFDPYTCWKTHPKDYAKPKVLTQEQFAVKLNISDRHLGRIETG